MPPPSAQTGPMAEQDPDDLPVVREGRLRRTLMAGLLGFVMLEVGLRVLLGNFAQTDFVQPSDNEDVCVELRPGAEVSYSGWLQRVATTTVRVNSFGGRGPAVDERPRPGVLRIATVGDSFALGQGVQEEDTFGQVASRALQREGIVNEVLNFATPGHGVPQATAQVLDKVVDLRPDVVLLSVFADDLSPSGTWCTSQPGEGLGAFVLQHIYSVRVVWLMTAGLRQPSLPPEASSPAGTPEARFKDSVQQLLRASRQHDFAVVVVLLTDRDAFSDPAYCVECPTAHDLVDDLVVDVVDLAPVWRQLRAERNTSFLRGEGHLSRQGNLRVGLQLGQALAGWAELQKRATDRAARLRP